MRWTIGLAVGFAAMFLANAVFVYLASHTDDPVATSYRTESR